MTDNKSTSERKLSRSSLVILIPILALGLAAALSYFLLDERVFLRLSRQPNNWHLNKWVDAFRQLGKSWVPIWLLLLWAWASRRPRPALIGLLALVLVGPTVLPVKTLVRRPRPRDVIVAESGEDQRNELLRSWSFPSGDTATVFAGATALVPFVGWPWALLFFAASGGVGLLRVTAFAHYPSDVCAGAAVGIFCGWLALKIGRPWLSMESSRFDWCRRIALLGVVVLPFLVGFFERVNPLLIFLKRYGVLIAGVYVIAEARARLRGSRGRGTCNS